MSSSSRFVRSENANPWDFDGPMGQGRQADDENSDSDLDMSPKEEAAHLLADQLADLYFSSTISAKQLCTMCYYAAKAGVVNERIEAYAFAPETRTGKETESGNFQKHLDIMMGLNVAKRSLHHLAIPGSDRHQLGRGIVDLPIRAPHEIVQEEIDADPTLLYRTEELVSSGDLPDNYFSHPVVMRSPSTTIPYALYSDSVPYSKVDSAVGFWLTNIASGRKHIAAIMRKSQLCKCGCKGWCSFYPVLSFFGGPSNVWRRASTRNLLFKAMSFRVAARLRSWLACKSQQGRVSCTARVIGWSSVSGSLYHLLQAAPALAFFAIAPTRTCTTQRGCRSSISLGLTTLTKITKGLQPIAKSRR